VSVTTRADSAAAERHKGLAFAFMAFTLWGGSAWFYKAIAYVSPVEIIAHRILWSVVLASAILIAMGRTADIKRAFKTPRILSILAITTLLISSNWLVFVVAVIEGWTLEASLGYFINPLMSVLIGMVLLGERMTPLQWAAVALAAIGVVIQTVHVGSLPWVGLFLAVTFAAYGYLRKTVDIGPAQGFLVEAILMLPVALAILGWTVTQGTYGFRPFDAPGTTLWLILCGPMTAGPLIFFAAGARRLQLATVGLMQYLAPSMIFVTAVFVFNEPFGPARLASFLFIWSGLAVFTIAAWRAQRGRR